MRLSFSRLARTSTIINTIAQVSSQRNIQGQIVRRARYSPISTSPSTSTMQVLRPPWDSAWHAGSNKRSMSASTSTPRGSASSSSGGNAVHAAVGRGFDTTRRTTAVHRAAVALGSNLGDRVGFIERAVGMMRQRGLRVLGVSPLYETRPMYYVDQDCFVNGACYVETSLEPLELLDLLQDIENKLDRVRMIEKGPRTVDLDIILYDDLHILHERLEVPHKLLLEREFVLRPLTDVLPEYTFPISYTSSNALPQSVSRALRQIRSSDTPMRPITTLAPQLPFITADDPGRKTHIMSIMNITPDSFSDGGMYSQNNLEAIQSTVRKQIEAGVTIFDIGGQSTRPHAELLTAEEELQRVLPVVDAIRSMPEARNIAISIDTFYSDVARETVKHGADIVNDVSAGLLDPDMLSTVAELGKTIVLMHMRGNPHTMNQLTSYPNGVVQGVAEELGERVAAARRAGIHPWRIILDPGIGFAKTQNQNVQLLKDLALLRARPEFSGLPWLLGVSRKGFIGKITGVSKASERVLGTAAAVTASIAGGADIVRVHDVPEMTQVAKMADAIYRPQE